MKKYYILAVISLMAVVKVKAQADTTASSDSSLRIINLNSYFIQHLDSFNVYRFRINKNQADYFWYLKNEPVGLSINKDNGQLTYKAAKNYFLSGKLKYDYPYKVGIGVQSLLNSTDRIDSFFTISFYNTEIISSRVKLSVSGPITIDEGEMISFRVQCETGSFPFENILFSSSVPLPEYKFMPSCNGEFNWTPGFDFVKDNESEREKPISLNFTASTRYQQKDSAMLHLIVRNALNYPVAKEEFELVNKNARSYILQLKYVFLQLDKKLKKVKSFRTGFDLSSAGSATAGTILNTSSSQSAKNTGKILPSIGVALVPIKEATAPNKTVEQNQASQIRTAIKRLEYMLNDNALVGEKDPDIVKKTTKLKDELKQVQIQLIDIPVELTGNMTEEELNNYFNSPKVNKKYRLKKKS